MRLVRVFFKKTDRGIYISHLDLNKAMQRSIKRSRLPVWYTMGYNPHMYMTFALPLSLGFEGHRESMDIRVLEGYTNAQVEELLSKALPPCIQLLEAADPVMDPKEIAWADYTIVFELGEGSIEEAIAAFQKFVSQKEVIVEKKSKKGIQDIDILPMFTVREIEAGEGEFTVKIRAVAGNTLNLNPSLLIDAFTERTSIPVEGSRVARTDILTADFRQFH